MRTTHEGVTFRPITEKDLPFLYGVYAGTRQEELERTGWNEEQKENFLRMQFHAQHTYYQEQFPEAAYEVIVCGNREAGRLYVDRRDDEIRIIDIALLPAFRNRGIGGAIMKELLDEAGKKEKPLRIHVEHDNPALRLYERLGFTRIEDKGVYYLMEWAPGSARQRGKTE